MNLTIDAMTGRFVRLEPFTAALRDEVGAGQDADAEGWAIMSSSGRGEHFPAWWDAAFGEH
ncbi:MAG TPA: N-acetyltransferase, partial [Caulobacteraceae bacterium]|nr:N-acetyltransferase [Caulobacteraceae bacterium]